MTQTATASEQMMHRAARVSDSIRAWRERRARAAGLLATVVPYTGYGSTTSVRVLGRVLLTRDFERRLTPRPEGMRGWRSFTSIPVADARVTVTIGDETREVRSDRSGLIDQVVPVELQPGWHTIGLQAENPPRGETIDLPPNEAQI